MESFSIKKRLKSFTYAWKGIRGFVCREHNVWIHLTIAMLVIIAGFIFDIEKFEWVAIIICIGVVIAAEAFNTAIERLVNLVSPEWHPIAGEVKRHCSRRCTDMCYRSSNRRIGYLYTIY